MRSEVPVRAERDILPTRLALRKACAALHFGSAETARIVTAGTELARNIHQYASRGVMRVRSLDAGGRQGIEIAFEDQGPGIANVDLAMTEGFSTSGGYGMGLPGASRLMDAMSIQSTLGVGTTVILTKWRQA